MHKFSWYFFQLNQAHALQYFRPQSGLNFKVDLYQENVNISKNGFYQRILLVSKYPKREWAKYFIFFKILLDGPLYGLPVRHSILNGGFY